MKHRPRPSNLPPRRGEFIAPAKRHVATGVAGRANTVRIIGGIWRRRLIRFPSNTLIRPTPDRVKETVFNWLGQELHGRRCLDLFSGSGALGFEAASRGAQEVVMVERESVVCQGLHETADALNATQVRIWAGDALEFLSEDRSSFDVVFVDPPFSEGATASLIMAIEPRVSALGVIYIESGTQIPEYRGWKVLRDGRAGTVRYQLLERE